MKKDSRCLYLIRHGQTTAAEDQIIGATDQSLSLEGENQASELSKSLTKIDAVKFYSSELDRAKHTASLLQSNLQIKSSALINEMNFGDWEKQTWAEVYDRDPHFFNHWAKNWATQAPPNGESFSDVINRCSEWYMEISKSNDCAVIVAHGGSLRALLCIILGLPTDFAFSFEFQHCHVSKIAINHGSAKAVYLNNPYFI